MKVKTSELSGKALDWAVWSTQKDPSTIKPRKGFQLNIPKFSADWSKCGTLIEQFQIFIDPPHEVHKSMITADGKPKGCWESYDNWHATISTRVAEKPMNHLWADFSLPGGPYRGEGETPQVAICRAVVSAKLGDEVEIPDELMEVKR